MPAKKKVQPKKISRKNKKPVKKSRFSIRNLSKSSQLVLFAAIFGVLGVAYLLYSNAIPTIDKNTQAVFYYSEGHAHEEFENDFGPLHYPTVLYGDGLLVCGVDHDGEDSLIASPTQKRLSVKEIKAFKDGVEKSGAAKLKTQQYRSDDDLIDPIAANTTIFTDFGNGAKQAVYSSGEKPAEFDSVASYLHEYCDANATEEYVAETYNLDVVAADAVSSNSQPSKGLERARQAMGGKVESNSRLGDVLQKLDGLSTTQSVAIDKTTARELRTKLSNKKIGTIQTDKGSLAVRIAPQIREFVMHGIKDESAKADSGKAYAATAKKVEFVWFYASNQSLQSGYSSKLTDTSMEIRNWYKSKIADEELIFAKNYTKKGTKTIAQYETCPSGKNCQGDKLLAAFYNVQLELGTLTDAEVLVIFQGSENSCKGWGGGTNMPSTNGQVGNATQGVGIINATGCSWTDGRQKIAAHELAHALGSAHYCHNYNVMADSSCSTPSNGLRDSILANNQKSTWKNYSWFFKVSPRYLNTNERLYGDGSLLSSKGSYRLQMQQSDGNLVVYGPSGAVWNSRSYGNPGSYVAFQSDGNLVLRKPSGKYCHASSNGKGGYRLLMQDDGNLVIYKSDLRTAVWSSKTHGWYCN